MNLLIRSVRILDPLTGLAKDAVDILVKNGIIDQIGSNLKHGDGIEVYEGNGNILSIGWLDMKANFRDPGNETEEDLYSGMEAAIAGGFTSVVIMPSTHPVVQTKSDVEYIMSRSRNHLVTILPAGALTVNREGKDITEMYDMKQSGAVAFTDDKRAVSDSGVLLRALQYCRNIGSVVISYPDDKFISGKGMVNEGIPSTMTGLKGMPSFAEEIAVTRDLKIAAYAKTPIHFSTLSTAGAVKLIKEAKDHHQEVTAEVAAHQLYFDDAAILDFDTNFKVKPPFRTVEDKNALCSAVADGTIQVIVSDHSPEDEESKIVEFDFASYGIIGLETAFAVANTALYGSIELPKLIACLTTGPRKVLGLAIPEIKAGSKADFTIFNPDEEWVVTVDHIRSKSKNTPFLGIKLKGRALAVMNNNQFRICTATQAIDSGN